MRISRAQMFMAMAKAAAMRSTCFRLNVGAIVVADNRPISVGYNGVPAGEPHCRGNACPGRFECHETIHAEKNALDHIPDEWLCDERLWDLYVTHSPCEKCLGYIVDHAHIKRIFYETAYRKIDHFTPELVACYDIEIYRVTPAGYVINHITGEVLEE